MKILSCWGYNTSLMTFLFLVSLILVKFVTDSPIICHVVAKDTETVSELQRGRSSVLPVAATDCGDRDG